MRIVTLSLPTDRLTGLGLFPGRFFRHNETLEVLQAFRLAGTDITLLVRILRKGRGPSEAGVARQGGALKRRYGLEHFELLGVDDEQREYTVLLRVSMTEGMGEMLRVLGSDLLPTRPFIITEAETLVSFYATDAELAAVRELLSALGLAYEVARSHQVSERDLRPLGNLTERQMHLLRLAHHLGYYKVPARTKLAHLAEIAGVSKAAVSKQLRLAEGKVFSEVLGEDTG